MQKPTWLNSIKVFVLDMDGTIYLGDRLFPYTKQFLETLKEEQKQYYFFTNNSSRSLTDYDEKLNKMEVPFQRQQLMNATQVMIAQLKEEGINRLFVLGTQRLREEFLAAGFHFDLPPERVLLGFDTELTYEKIKIACDWIRAGVPVLGINPDFNCPVEGGMIPDCGSIGAMIEAATGVKIEYYGKPHRKTFNFVLARTGVQEEQIVWVGDRLYTDIAVTKGTRARSILVLSGETRQGDLLENTHKPDGVVEDLAELTRWLKLD